MVLLTGHVILWAELRKPRFAGNVSSALLWRLRMRAIVSCVGLLLLMGSFGIAQQQQYDGDACGFTVQGEPKHATIVGPVLAAQKLPAKGTDKEMAQNVSIPELTEAISARLVAQWEGWKNQDAASNNAIIADDFNSFWPDGSRHIGKPTAQQMSEQPITGYKLSQFRVVPVGADAALVTYFADVKPPGDNVEFQMAVGEVWVKRNSQWLVRGYSGTLIK
jgi:hypothetical protein